MSTSADVRPEMTVLNEDDRRRVAKQLRRKRSACSSCGEREFTIGDALYLGFLFLQEELDAYMVALTCVNPECPTPHTGIRLRESEFLRSSRGR